MSKRIVLTVLLSGAILVGCDNYDTRPRPPIPAIVEPPPPPPPPAPVKPMDVAGIWFSRTENNAVNYAWGQNVLLYGATGNDNAGPASG